MKHNSDFLLTTASSMAKRDIFRRLASDCGATVRFIAVCISDDEARRCWERNNTTGERFTVSEEDFETCARELSLPLATEGTIFYQAGEEIAHWIAHHFGEAIPIRRI